MKYAVAVMTALLVASVLTACTREQSCVDWVFYDDVADMADDANLVIVGEPAASRHTVDRFGLDAAVHSVDVDHVVKGDYDGQTIEVISTPATCQEGAPYPDGDPLDVNEPVELFLFHDDDGSWSLITGYQGVELIGADGTLPWEPTP